MTSTGRVVIFLLLLAAGWAAAAEELVSGVSASTLSNGLRLVVVERHTSPVVALCLRSNVGLWAEPAGKSGIGSMIERMFYRGGETTGSLDTATEAGVLARAEAWFDQRDSELARGPQANLLTAEDYNLKGRVLIDSVARLGIEQVVTRGLAVNGFENVGIEVRVDYTALSALGPSNRAELWFRLVGDWLRRPSIRGFYADRDAVQAIVDRSARQSIIAKLSAALLPAAFANHPYARVASRPAELESVRPKDALAFMRNIFSAGNLVLVVAGDTTPDAARRLAENYFGQLSGGVTADPPAAEPALPPAGARINLVDDNETLWSVSWRRPGRNHPDDPVFDILAALLNGDANARLRQELMGERALVNNLQVLPAYPGDRFETLFSIIAAPSAGADPREIEKLIGHTIDQLARQPIATEALALARAQVEHQTYRGFDSPVSLAQFLARAYGDYGGIKPFAAVVESFGKVTGADVQRVATKYFGDQQRFVVAGGQGLTARGSAP